MAIQVIGTIVYAPLSSNALVSAVTAGATAMARVPTVTGSVVTQVARPFNTMEELLPDAGTIAGWHNSDMLISSVSFRAAVTTNERNYLVNHHAIFADYSIPADLVRATVFNDVTHAQINDPNYRTTMAGFVSQYGIANMYQLLGNEWDQDPPGSGGQGIYWDQFRFNEAGSTSAPFHPTSSMTRQQCYDQFFHFYLANNHAGAPFGSDTYHHQLGQLLNLSYQTRGWKAMTMNVYVGNVHFAYEMGVNLVMVERNNDDISGLVGSLGIMRGAGSQYSSPWGIDMSQSRTWGPHGGNPTSYNTSGVLLTGWSNATYKRSFYLTYFGGADLLFLEGISYELNGSVNINGRLYIPLATEIRNFNDFALNRHPQRGVAHVPVAVMKDHITQWEPMYGQFSQGRSVWYRTLPANAGENMMFNLWNLIYPNYNQWGTSTTTTEPWGSGRWGEQFDVITERITSTPMSQYRAVIVSMNTVMDATLQAKFNTYVQAGGIVVINAKQLSGTGHESLTGVHIVGTASTSGNMIWDVDGSIVANEPTFNYSTCTLGTATNLYHTGTNTTQVARNVLGAGEVWTVMPDYMSNPANNATLGIANRLIDVLVGQNAVAWITGGNHTDIDFCITVNGGTSGHATVVCIANTSNSNTNWTGTVNFPGTALPVREWVTDTTPASTQIGGNTQVTAAVLSGDVRVYAVG